jgi:hypothetical protein
MHAGGKDGQGSFKSQFKKADASGARHALIFGADELAQGMVTVKPLRDAGAAQVQRPWPNWPVGPRPAGPGRRSIIGSPASRRGATSPLARALRASVFMATNLDLQEQEQIDAVKAFWGQYGNLITWTVTLVLVAFAGWNGWNWWQREQAGRPAPCSTRWTRRSRPATPTRRGGSSRT